MRDDAISGVTEVNGESAALVSLVAWRCHDGSAAFGTVIIEKGDAQRGKGMWLSQSVLFRLPGVVVFALH